LAVISEIVEEIVNYMNKILAHPTYMGIFNNKGQAIFIDEALKEYYQFISSFINENFELLSVGDHSIPLSGLNLAFYKITNNAMIILHTKEGPVGQLLAFKSRMFDYAKKIEEISTKFTDEMIKQIPRPRVKQVSKAGSAERIPVLKVDINKKKFAMDEASVLHIIDGKKTITEICEEIKIPRLKVNEILKKYQKKGWLKLKRVIGRKEPGGPRRILKATKRPVKVAKPKPTPTVVKKTSPKPVKAPAPSIPKSTAVPFAGGNPSLNKATKSNVTTTKIPEFTPSEIEIQLSPDEEEGIYYFPIATQEKPHIKLSKNEQKILKLCDGRNTVDDICQIFATTKIELMQTLRKLESKGVVRLTQIFTEQVKETTSTLIKDRQKEEPAISSEKNKEIVGKLDELLEKVEENISAKKIPPPVTEIPKEIITEDISTEEIWIDDTEFEETLSDLNTLLQNSGDDEGAMEEKSFNAALNELTGLLSENSPTEGPPEPVSIETPNDPAGINPTISSTSAAPQTGYDIDTGGAQVVCPHCSAALPSTKRICPQCGNPIRSCPHCSAPISIHTRICPECSGIVSK